MPRPTTPSSKRGLFYTALGLMLVLGVIWFLRGRPAETGGPQATRPASADAPKWTTRVPAPNHIVRLASGRPEDRTKVGLWMLEEPTLPVVVADALIASRFPRGSIPLHRDMVDVLSPNRRYDTPQVVHHKDGSIDGKLRALITGDKFRIVGEQTLAASFQVLKDDAVVPVTLLGARVRTVEPNTHKPLGPELPVSFVAGADNVYRAEVKLGGTPLGTQVGFADLEVDYDPSWQGGESHPSRATLDLFYQPEGQVPARFNGLYREELRDGSLKIFVGVDVKEPGEYVIDANLFDADGNPVAMLTAHPTLPEGQQREFELNVYGRVVREAEAKAPFVLRNLRGFRILIGQDPDRHVMADGAEFMTKTYKLEDFTDAEYWEPGKEQTIRDLVAQGQNSGHTLMRRTLADAMGEGWSPKW